MWRRTNLLMRTGCGTCTVGTRIPAATYNSIHQYNHTAWDPSTISEGRSTYASIKNGKDQKIPSNYRGITVTTTISKILEHTLQKRLSSILDESQSKLQRGFTARTSPLNAAFLVSEAIAEHTGSKNPMALVTLYAEKAFYRVWYERLFQKLYDDGIHRKLWLIRRDLQAEGT